MGSVYRALDPALGREVAIKALAHDFRDDAASLRRFEREARLLATLNHPNIAAIYGFEMIDGAPYLVLELVEGETLADRLRRGPLPVDGGRAHRRPGRGRARRRRTATASCTATSSPPTSSSTDDGPGQGAGLRHRQGGARGPEETRATPTAEPTTMPGPLVGTAPYMSPEQVRGEAVDTRTRRLGLRLPALRDADGPPRVRGDASASEVLAAVLRDERGLDGPARRTRPPACGACCAAACARTRATGCRTSAMRASS